MTTMTMNHHDDTPATDDPLLVHANGAVRMSTIQSLRVTDTSPPRLVVVADTACFDLEGENAIDFLRDFHEADPLSRVATLLAKFGEAPGDPDA